MAQLTDGLKIQLLGDAELNDFFNKALTFKEQKSVMISAYRKAGKPVIDEARQLLRIRRKKLSKKNRLDESFGMIPMKSRKPAMLIGARKSKGFKGFHGHLVNEGTKNRLRKIKRSGIRGKLGLRRTVSAGRMPATHFWDDALTNKTPTVIANMQKEMQKALSRLVKRNIKKQTAA
jgi:hypothetical protein